MGRLNAHPEKGVLSSTTYGGIESGGGRSAYIGIGTAGFGVGIPFIGGGEVGYGRYVTTSGGSGWFLYAESGWLGNTRSMGFGNGSSSGCPAPQ